MPLLYFGSTGKKSILGSSSAKKDQKKKLKVSAEGKLGCWIWVPSLLVDFKQTLSKWNKLKGLEFPSLGVGIKSDMNTKIVKMFLDYSFSLETLDKRSIVSLVLTHQHIISKQWVGQKICLGFSVIETQTFFFQPNIFGPPKYCNTIFIIISLYYVGNCGRLFAKKATIIDFRVSMILWNVLTSLIKGWNWFLCLLNPG